MDLRQRKTLAAIREAFLGLRAERPLERISVRELAERAQIGKATFYLHYHSVYDLSRALQLEAVERIVGAVEEPGEFLADPASVTRRLLSAFQENRELVDVLFSGEQTAVLGASIEEAIRSRLGEGLGGADGLRASALLTFAVQGGYYAYRRATRGDAGGREPSAAPAPPARRRPDEEVVGAIADASAAVVALAGADGAGADARAATACAVSPRSAADGPN